MFLTLMALIPLILATTEPATNLLISSTGLPHFFRVNERLYRGAQPSREGWDDLGKLGVKTVVDLRRRSEHSCEAESLAVYEAGMRYVNFPMDGFATPTNGQIESFLELVKGDEVTFVHCKLGRDRTGTVIAAYRIARENWTNERARAEADARGMQWYSKGMKRFIANYRANERPVTTPGVPLPASAGR